MHALGRMIARLIPITIALSLLVGLAHAEAVIPPGQDDLVAAMLGGGRVLANGCRLSSGSVEKTYVVGHYDCGPATFEIELRSIDDSSNGPRTTKFVIVAHDAPPALVDDVRRLVLANESGFRWFTPAETKPAPSAMGERNDRPARSLLLSLGWLALPFALAMALRSRRWDRRLLLLAASSALLALIVRLAIPAAPANYFTDLLGPRDAVTPPWTPREAGIHGFCRALSLVVPLSASAVITLQRILGSCSVGLVVLATGTAPPEGDSRRTGLIAGAIVGILFALDPMQASLAASDAMHVPALFAWSVGALVYARISAEEQPSRWFLAALFTCALLPGLVRVELALSPLFYPFLFGRWRGARAPWAILIVPAVLAGSFALATSFTSSVEAPTLDRMRRWLTSGFTMLVPHRDGWIPSAVTQIAVVGGVVGLVRRRPRLAMALAALIAIHAVHILSPLAGESARGPLAVARHEIIHVAALIVLTSWGALEIIDAVRVRFPTRGAIAIAATLLVACLVIERAPFQRPRYTYQAEYRFLSENLSKVDPSCRLVAVWHRGVNGIAFESALALPNPLLAYDAPQRPWVIVSDPADLSNLGPGCVVYFKSSFCQLDANAPFGDRYPDAREILRSLEPVCIRLEAASIGTIAEQRVEGRALLWPYRSGDVTLALRTLSTP